MDELPPVADLKRTDATAHARLPGAPPLRERVFPMNEWMIVRRMARRIGTVGDTRLGRALDEWAQSQSAWLTLAEGDGWAAAHGRLISTEDGSQPPQVLAVSDVLAQVLELDAFDSELLRLCVAVDRLPRVASLTELWSEQGGDLPELLGELAGAPVIDAIRAVRRSAALRLGLVQFYTKRTGAIEVDVQWSLERLLDTALPESDAVIAALAGATQPPRLSLADFGHVGDAEFLVRLLRGAVAERAQGINILIHGPPGTGKTELARTLARAAGLSLHAVGEADDDGCELSRWGRVNALRLAQRVLAPRGRAALLFDEMEDLIGDAGPSEGDWIKGRQGSKVFVNRLIEDNAVPVIWTTNAIGNVDGAILRRMSFVLKLDLPSPRTARGMLSRIAGEEACEAHPALLSMIDRAPETATVLRVAVRAGRIAGDRDLGARPASALVRALRGGQLSTAEAGTIDLDLFETVPPLGPLISRIEAEGATDLSVLLTGPPGTGKSALAYHIARAVDRPLVVKRASDLLSRWVGGTEAAIAGAFADAREREHVLFFDEVDSLLFDRASASQNWEAGQVNEMLTWLDRHPLPVIAATNHAHRLDPAALRRFVFKLELAPLGRDRAARAFRRFFGIEAPEGLAQIVNLTPGDFSAVQRQLRHAPARSADDIVERLQSETAWRPDGGRIGF